MSAEAQKTRPAGTAADGKTAEWWCNFCDFKTDDQKEYLGHSCVDVLKQRGKTVVPRDKNSCG
jgi:hypothetical protein